MSNILKGFLMILGWLTFEFIVWVLGYWHKTILVPIIFTPLTAMVFIIATNIAKRS